MDSTPFITATNAPTTTTTQDATVTTTLVSSTTENTTSTMMTYSTKAIDTGDDSDDNVGVIIGCVFGAVAFVVIIGLLAGFLIYRRRRRERKKNKPLPVAPHKDELDRPHIDDIGMYQSSEENITGTGTSTYANIDAEGKPNDETNPELDSEGYLKKHTPLKKAVKKIKGKKKRKKRNKHDHVEEPEPSDNTGPAYGNVGFGADGVALEMTTVDNDQTKTSGELGYVDGRIAGAKQTPAHYYNTDGIKAEKSTPRRTRRTQNNNSDSKTKQQNIDTTKPSDTLGINPGGEMRQSHYENLPHKQSQPGFQRQISEEVYENQ